MIESKAEMQTSKAEVYIQMLCKHFGHKTDVQQVSDDAFLINLEFGTGEMTAAGSLLKLVAKADDEENLERAETVLGSHLERFAFKEKLTVNWFRS